MTQEHIQELVASIKRRGDRLTQDELIIDKCLCHIAELQKRIVAWREVFDAQESYVQCLSEKCMNRFNEAMLRLIDLGEYNEETRI